LRASFPRLLLFAALLLAAAAARGQAAQSGDAASILVARLELENYKASIRELAQFGDRREGTGRNRAALDWIETRLREIGCPGIIRHAYHYTPPPRTAFEEEFLPDIASPGVPHPDASAQADPRLRAINAEPPQPGRREQIYCTKSGASVPEEMYIVSAHFDGIGHGEAANDDASGVALVLELARIMNAPNVRTERSVRFLLFNSEEDGMIGSRAYVADRQALQGIEDPAGSGLYPEPRWLGIIQHDMMLFDHGLPRADGSVSPLQRQGADVNIEFAAASAYAASSEVLARALQAANARHASRYAATIGANMGFTDSAPFRDHTAAVSLRENERLAEIGLGANPHWHRPSDLYSAYSDDDFLLGLNAAETTLGAIAALAGASIAD